MKHTAEGSTVTLENGTPLKCRLIVDCSGHYSELVEKDGPHNPGVQIAYGAEVEVKGMRCCFNGTGKNKRLGKLNRDEVIICVFLASTCRRR